MLFLVHMNKETETQKEEIEDNAKATLHMMDKKSEFKVYNPLIFCRYIDLLLYYRTLMQ